MVAICGICGCTGITWLSIQFFVAKTLSAYHRYSYPIHTSTSNWQSQEFYTPPRPLYATSSLSRWWHWETILWMVGTSAASATGDAASREDGGWRRCEDSWFSLGFKLQVHIVLVPWLIRVTAILLFTIHSATPYRAYTFYLLNSFTVFLSQSLRYMYCQWRTST